VQISQVASLSVLHKCIYWPCILQPCGTSPVRWTAVPTSLFPFSVVQELEAELCHISRRHLYFLCLEVFLSYFFIYILFLSLLLLFSLRTCLTSQQSCRLLILHEKLGWRRALFRLEGRLRAMHAPNFCHASLFISSLGVLVALFASVLLSASHRSNSF
jgi:hypothetical protein